MTRDFTPTTLPTGWWHQPEIADRVHRKIPVLVEGGLTDHEVANRLGCSSFTVKRYRKANGIKANKKYPV